MVTALGLLGAGAFIIAAQAQPQHEPTAQASSCGELLAKMVENPDQWTIPSGNYAAWRYSKLDQINASNVKDLQVAWPMSTGTDRGLEASRS